MMTREQVGTEIGLMTGRIKKTFVNGRDNLANAGTVVSEKTRRAARKTDYYVHDNAWKMLGIAAGLAFLTGFVLSRVNKDRYLIGEAVPVDSDGNGNTNAKAVKKEKSGSWELVHAAIPLALFAWKAFQSSRCAKRVMVQ
jgi:ElaB/YqjD/DUF883 family membrane-anchored ribosome-binding protein